MEPVNPLLPAHRPDTPGLLRRTGGLLNAVRGIKQEASAEFWYGLAMTHGAGSETRLAYFAKSEGLLRYEITTIRRALENESSDDKYRAIDSDGDNWGYDFDTKLFYNKNQNILFRLNQCYTSLVDLLESPAVKADTWIELAELLKIYELPHLTSKCYINSFACENRLQTVIEEWELCSYTWTEGWDSHSKERILSHRETIKKYPDYPNSYYLSGLEKFGEGKYGDALNDFNKYEALNGKTNIRFYMQRCWLHHQLGNSFSARQDVDNVSRLGGRLDAYLGIDWDDPWDSPVKTDSELR